MSKKRDSWNCAGPKGTGAIFSSQELNHESERGSLIRSAGDICKAVPWNQGTSAFLCWLSAVTATERSQCSLVRIKTLRPDYEIFH